MAFEQEVETIKKALNTGKCPVCGEDLSINETMTRYVCSKDKSHFDLAIEFIENGEAVKAIFNGSEIPSEVASMIDW